MYKASDANTWRGLNSKTLHSTPIVVGPGYRYIDTPSIYRGYGYITF